MRRTFIPAVLALALAVPSASAASLPQERIVNGSAAGSGEYPSQGFLLFDIDPGPAQSLRACGGTVVSDSKFLTAAHCASTTAGTPLPPQNFNVFLDETHLTFDDADRHFVSAVDVHPHYAEDVDGHANDVAVLTFSAPVATAPTRVVKPDERDLWTPGTTATIIGWGTTSENGPTSDDLLKATVPIRTDADCRDAYGTSFVASSMLCAGAADPANNSADTCQGDSGGPLLVDDGSAPAVAGVVSWGLGCNEQGFPGIYTRVGEAPLNAWVRGRLYDVDFTAAPAALQAGHPVAFTASGPGSSGFSWDFEGDGTRDASGPTATHTYPAPGAYEVVLRATDPEGAPAEQRRTILVGAAPAPPAPAPATAPAPAPPSAPSLVPGPLATILVSGKPKVRHGRFTLRVNFATSAPSGTAVIEVFKGKRKIGIARTRVRRGGSKQVRVKLTPTGRRLLARSAHKRMQVKIRVRVGRKVLRSKRATLRG
jgi:Trypsin/PKD domain